MRIRRLNENDYYYIPIDDWEKTINNIFNKEIPKTKDHPASDVFSLNKNMFKIFETDVSLTIYAPFNFYYYKSLVVYNDISKRGIELFGIEPVFTIEDREMIFHVPKKWFEDNKHILDSDELGLL